VCGALKLANAGDVDAGVGARVGASVGATVTGTAVALADADGLVPSTATDVTCAGLRNSRSTTRTTARISTAPTTYTSGWDPRSVERTSPCDELGCVSRCMTA
jgi:hypothetical protein